MFQDRKVDENGEIMILPKDSDKWLTKEEFIKIYPDYKIFMSLELGTQVNSEYPSEIQLAYNKSEEIFKKYVEKFISELSEEEKQLLREYDIFSAPVLQVAGIKGI